MKNFKRQPTDIIQKQLKEQPQRIIVVAGPRQIGKTTAVTQVLDLREKESYLFLAVDNPTTEQAPIDFSATHTEYASPTTLPIQKNQQWLIEQWRAARQLAKAWHEYQLQRHNSQPAIGTLNQAPPIIPFVLVFDEIHLIDNWSSVVKGLWDQDRLNHLPMHVLVLGSAPLLMQKNLSESLLGRYETIPMTHWSFEEMRDCFDFTLDQYIYFGGYPGPARLAHTDEVRWRNVVKSSLIEPNLVKDVMALANIEKPAVLRQLFELGCSYSGQIVAVNKLLQQLDDAGNTTTLSHYLNLLKASGLLAGLAKYTHDTMRQRASKPKLNVLNTAFLSIYSGHTFEQAKQDRAFWGRLVESCIGAHLLNSAQGITQISYWNESSMEVDFVVHQGNRVAALEVKSSTPKTGANKGLTAFTNKHAQLNLKTHIVGGADIALAEALCKPPESWLED